MKPGPVDRKRAYEICELFSVGWSFQRIGDKFGISRERVRQIYNQVGPSDKKSSLRDSNRKKVTEHQKLYQNKRYSKLKARLDIIASKRGCKICGTHVGNFDWHHRKRRIKGEHAISGILQTRSIQYINKELKKCDVLCVSCHRSVHYLMKRCKKRLFLHTLNYVKSCGFY
jgi:hypothetical protein